MKFKSQININFANITRYLLFLPPFLLPLHLQKKWIAFPMIKNVSVIRSWEILMKFKSQININFANITRYLLFLPQFLLPLHLQKKWIAFPMIKKVSVIRSWEILMKFKSQININLQTSRAIYSSFLSFYFFCICRIKWIAFPMIKKVSVIRSCKF